MSACPPFEEGPDTDFDIPAVLDSSRQHQDPAVSPALWAPAAAGATSPGSAPHQQGSAAGRLREARLAASSALFDRGSTLDQQGLGADRRGKERPAASPNLDQASYSPQGLLRMAQEAELPEEQPVRPRRVVRAHWCWPCWDTLTLECSSLVALLGKHWISSARTWWQRWFHTTVCLLVMLAMLGRTCCLRPCCLSPSYSCTLC